MRNNQLVEAKCPVLCNNTNTTLMGNVLDNWKPTTEENMHNIVRPTLFTVHKLRLRVRSSDCDF